MDEEYKLDRAVVELKLDNAVNQFYGPSHFIDTLKECIKILQPYAEKEKEKTHA